MAGEKGHCFHPKILNTNRVGPDKFLVVRLRLIFQEGWNNCDADKFRDGLVHAANLMLPQQFSTPNLSRLAEPRNFAQKGRYDQFSTGHFARLSHCPPLHPRCDPLGPPGGSRPDSTRQSGFAAWAKSLPGEGIVFAGPLKFTVAEKLKDISLHEIDLTEGAVLETGCVYIVKLMESLTLPPGLSAAANPKSSTGRLDIFTRVIADHAQEFDKVPEAYDGPLYAEISPRTFPILAQQGSRLSQIRFRSGAATASDALIHALHAKEPLITSGEVNIDGGLALSVDLIAMQEDAPVGFRAKRHSALVDVDKKAALEVLDYWEPIWRQGSLILDPDQFYILASKEAVRVPPTHAAEMVPFNPLVGEFRVHYAGFFDPGFWPFIGEW